MKKIIGYTEFQSAEVPSYTREFNIVKYHVSYMGDQLKGLVNAVSKTSPIYMKVSEEDIANAKSIINQIDESWSLLKPLAKRMIEDSKKRQ